jgi:hypothetical protein
LVLAYSSLNEFDSASQYLDLYAELKDSLSLPEKMVYNQPAKSYESQIDLQNRKIKIYKQVLFTGSIVIVVLIILVFVRKRK